MKKGQTQLSIQLSEQDKVLSSERVDSVDSTKVDFTFKGNEQFFLRIFKRIKIEMMFYPRMLCLTY